MRSSVNLFSVRSIVSIGLSFLIYNSIGLFFLANTGNFPPYYFWSTLEIVIIFVPSVLEVCWFYLIVSLYKKMMRVPAHVKLLALCLSFLTYLVLSSVPLAILAVNMSGLISSLLLLLLYRSKISISANWPAGETRFGSAKAIATSKVEASGEKNSQLDELFLRLGPNRARKS